MLLATFGEDLGLDPILVEREMSFPSGKLDEAAVLKADIKRREMCFSPERLTAEQGFENLA